MHPLGAPIPQSLPCFIGRAFIGSLMWTDGIMIRTGTSPGLIAARTLDGLGGELAWGEDGGDGDMAVVDVGDTNGTVGVEAGAEAIAGCDVPGAVRL